MGGAVSTALDRFTRIWAVDFEFVAPPGERPDPVCMVALELRTGVELRIWDQDLRACNPIAWCDDDLLIAYYAPAEMTCFLALGWEMPRHVLDLFAEYRVHTNGRTHHMAVDGRGLLAALANFGLSHLDGSEKTAWRDRIMLGRPFSAADRAGALDYCASDVIALQELLPALVSRLESRPHWLDHALLRGRYMKAVAVMQHRGVPMDLEMLDQLRRHWPDLKTHLIDSIREDFPIFDGATLKHGLFEQWLIDHGIPWATTETGRLSMTEDTFKKMAKAHPIVAPLHEVVNNLGKLRITDLEVGVDGRNRTMLSPFGAATGRNTPSASRFIFAPSVWLRSLIKPGPGRAVAYVDFGSQEIVIAAALSKDKAMLRAYESGDPYLAFAIDAGLAPPGATKASHKLIRERCKALVLGTLYGMGQETLAGHLQVPVAEARELLRAHRRTYPTFWDWSQAATDHAMITGAIDTCFGWRLHITERTRPTSLQNHPMQSHGAEMLRLACTFLVEAGIELVAPVHDAVMVEASIEEIDQVVERTQELMQRAGRIVLGGVEIRTDVDVIRWPDRFSDPRGEAMWERVTGIVGQLEALEASPEIQVTTPEIQVLTP